MDKHISDMLYSYNHNNANIPFEDDKTNRSSKNLINPYKFKEPIQINKDINFYNNKIEIDQKCYINQKDTNKSKNAFKKNQIFTKPLTSLEGTLDNSMLNNSINENVNKNNKFSNLCSDYKEAADNRGFNIINNFKNCGNAQKFSKNVIIQDADANNKFYTPKKESLEIEIKNDKNVNILTEELKKQTIASLQDSNFNNIETRLLRRHTTCENEKKEIFLEQNYKNENSSFTTNVYNTNSKCFNKKKNPDNNLLKGNSFSASYDNSMNGHTTKDSEYPTKLYMLNKVKNSDIKVMDSQKEKSIYIDKKWLFKDVCKSYMNQKLEIWYENGNHSSKEDDQENFICDGNKREIQSVVLNCSNSVLNISNINMDVKPDYNISNTVHIGNSTYIGNKVIVAGKKKKKKQTTKQGETHTCKIGQENIEKINVKGEVVMKSNIYNAIDFVPLRSNSDHSDNFCEKKNDYYNIIDSNEKNVKKKNIKIFEHYEHFENIKKITDFKGNSPNLYSWKKTVFEALKKNKNCENKGSNSCENKGNNNSSNIMEEEENILEKKKYVNVMNPLKFSVLEKKEKIIVPTNIEKNYSNNQCNTNCIKCSILNLSNKKNNCFNNFCHASSDNNNSNEHIKGKKNYKKIVKKKNKINNPQNSIKNVTLINPKTCSIDKKKKKNIDDFFPSTYFLLSNGAKKTNLSSSDIIEKKKLYNNLNMIKNKYSIYSDNIKVKNSVAYNVTNKEGEMLKGEKTKEECGNGISLNMPKNKEQNVGKMEENCIDFVKCENELSNYVFKRRTNYFCSDRKTNEIKNDNEEEKKNNIRNVCAKNNYKKNNVMHDILSNNKMIIKDIEEIKKNKLFFEEICVFRMNEYTEESEQSDIYNYSDIKGEFYQSDDYDKENKRKPINLFELSSYNDIDITKLELNKNCYKHLNDEVKKLIKEEDTYHLEMNIGLMFKKYINVIMNLSYNYLIIKKNEKNVLTCISYNNIIEIDIVKKNPKKGKISFKLVYVFKKKELKAEKNITLIFKTTKMEIYEKIKEKIGPLFDTGKMKSSFIGNKISNNIIRGKSTVSKVDNKKIYIDVETVYNYIINKYKQVHLLYLNHLLQMTEKKFKKKSLEQGFEILRLNREYAKEIEAMGKKKNKLINDFTNKFEYYIKKHIQKNYFNILLIKSYETHFINYQKKTNDMLFNVIVKEKSAYEENIGRQSILLLFNALTSLYKSKMSKYFRSFVNNNRNFSKGKNAFSYTLTHINTILVKYETRHKAFVLSRLKFNYNNVSYFSFVMYKTYLKKLFLGYICLRDNRIFIKLVIEKNVIKLINRISRVIENQKYYAFLKLQKYIYEEKEKMNKKICDNLMYTNNELCNNMDKIGIEKGINILEYFYKFKIKENLIKYFYILKGSQVSVSISQNKYYLKYSAIFVFVLNKILQRKVQDILLHFVLKCFQNNNKNKLIYSTKNLELLFIQKEKRDVMSMLRFYDKFPYLFKYRNMNKAEIFTACIQNFMNTYNRKLLLNFLLKLYFLQYKEKFMKAYNCIGHIYNFINILSKKIKKTIKFPFMLLLQNARIINNQILVNRLKIKKKTQLKNSNNTRTFSSAPDPVSVITKYPYLLYNMEMSPDHTFLPDDKYSFPSNNSISDSFPYVYEDMDKIKRKISDFNNKVGNMN
ncbi:conserved Plasmodium protein, unknown function [Plasmodium berghei]|uniref:Uncharacterized protein n=2 Tax=Plasmodium berghei TaxID=5821 RepID=A0A509AEL8_PLABA|nr:conserved Plasmodium protein, unknown function [Plasmodium berghei ANKA]CXH93110.1 conserved Plasmodium protein, unknown function [Plasmodium berghei]SCL90750.1 conserved Plasmodium protein, unknown function [Plasmodium berghei]SCM15345.1 conserved Plasmodium protein, unknown function [Plasmodium berghei]SCM17138.1 conserved Plasmodium protein, unknown function [Plasmodium berghei]SCN22145.1 conserved Plasmodium protein, unknown function [Plasmodium berghei]|eukprot:XP_034419929.1 conserved Plasmodium protein, unknown function [Plasmodium berghei ANKA]